MDTYIRLMNCKDVWDALETQYGVSDAGNKLYIMEQFLNYRMIEHHFVVEQAHKIHTLANDLKNYRKNLHMCCPTSLCSVVLSSSCHNWRSAIPGS